MKDTTAKLIKYCIRRTKAVPRTDKEMRTVLASAQRDARKEYGTKQIVGWI